MVNYIFVAVGQCGNQLTYELLNMIYDHCTKNEADLEQIRQQQHQTSKRSSSARSSAKGSTQKKSPARTYFHYDKSNLLEDQSQDILFDSVFRPDSPSSSDSSSQKKTMCTARVICLDTEPKVIDHCLQRTKAHYSPLNSTAWHYETKNMAYRHSGAGNNWALGYSMCTGEFLEVAINCIRSEIERCDDIPVLVYLHSLAGGTGSGLGTHLVETSYEEFSNCFHYHVLIAPHSFSEVIVQYYNTLLCLSKLYSHSHGILIFDNENAQLLCKQMKFIEKPVLMDLNQTIANHLMTLFLPKRNLLTVDPFFTSSSFSHMNDDLAFLCSNPYYRFFTIKLTPQTSIDSIDFTYDSWFSLIHTIQRMQLSGCVSERNISQLVKKLGRSSDGSPSSYLSTPSVGSSSTFLPSYQRPTVSSHKTYSMSEDRDDKNSGLAVIQEAEENQPQQTEDEIYSLFFANNPSSKLINPQESTLASASQSLIKSVASIITCHGEGSTEALFQLQETFQEDSDFSKDPLFDTRTKRSAFSSYSHHTYRSSAVGATSVLSKSYVNYHQTKPKLFEEYIQSHANYLHTAAGMSPIQFYSTNFYLNQYQRSSTVLSNDQSVLPLLNRTMKKSSDMFHTKAYVHQYTTNGLTVDDFVDAFQTLGSVIRSYSDL